METVIPPEKASSHTIRKYRFKVLSAEGVSEPEHPFKEEGVRPYRFRDFAEVSETPKEDEEVADSPTSSEEAETAPEGETPSDEGMLEEMLKKVDELSTELVKTQMLLEKREREFEGELSAARREGVEEGIEKGRQACGKEMAEEMAAMKERIAASIQALEETQRRFLEKVDTIEEELIETAIDLARQVIVKEVESGARQIALRLARLLLQEVKEAAHVTLKVSPHDFDYLREHIETSEKIDIVADRAVAPGGVVILSDVGNIDGQIMHRFERIKEAVFGPPREGEG